MSNLQQQQPTLAILCGGGPAPGINSVISSVTIEAINNGWAVLGILDGFSHLAKGVKQVVPLTINMVSRIHLDGGSILRTSRFNPTKDENLLRTAITTLIDLGVTHLVTIGGDDTAYSAYRVSAYAKEKLGIDFQVVHVPKTIDNDLPLPEGIPTFGFETARSLGAQLVSNLMEDAKTTGRWFFVVAMGRTAGHLALGIGKSAGASVTVIPEEFGPGKIKMQYLVDILVGSIIKRLAAGRDYGVAIIGEGLFEKIEHDSAMLEAIGRDDHGHIRLGEVDFSNLIKQAVMAKLAELGVKMSVVDKEIGYEVRCAQPNSFDIEYTRNLGYGAFEFLAQGGTGALVTVQNNQIVPIPLEEIQDPKTGRTQARLVNVESVQYKIARKYMLRLEKGDFENPAELAKLAAIIHVTPEEFAQKFGYLVQG